MRNKIKMLTALTAAVFTAGVSLGQTTYIWNGSVDGNWSNTANWAGGILPADDSPGAGNSEGISLPYADVIEFSGSAMPTNNLPGIGGLYDGGALVNTGNTPRLVFKSGGEFDLAVKGQEDNIWTNPEGIDRVIFTIGDGIGGGTEEVTVNWTGGTQISRHGNNDIFRYVINSDGSLNRTGGFDFSRGAGRPAIMTINGGMVVASGTTYDLKSVATAFIEFSELGSSYQSAWGGEFNDIPDVEASIGVDFFNTSGIAGSELIATSVGGGWKVELLSSNDVANLYKTYTWTGAAGDQDWNNTANWADGLLPVDDTADTETKYEGLTMPYKQSIVFAGSAMPTSNVPEIGNWYDATAVQGDSPTMIFNSGGEISLDVTGEFAAFLTNPANDTRSVLTVGDGVGGGTEDVIVNIAVGETNSINGVLNRHNNGTHDFLVKSDGTLNIEHVTTNFVDVTYNTTSRPVIFTIEGGAVVIDGAVKDLHTASYVSFTAPGGTFTAQYGQQFPSITDVWEDLGTVFIDNTGNALGTLQAVDVDGTSFTVAVVATAIQWSSAQGITGDADVSTEGSLEYAYNAGSSDTTVNGVLFTGTGSGTDAFGADVMLTSFTGTTTDFGSLSLAPYAGMTPEYQSLLSSAVTNGTGTSAITLKNLIIGSRYQVQVWVNDSSSANTNAQPVYLSIGTANTVELESADPAVEGAVGQYGLGTFVADAATQTFALGGNRLQLNAIQVRQVNPLGVGYWTGTGGATWDAATTVNFAINEFGQALSESTFDVAKAVNGSVTFADAYFDNDTPVAVAENNITIDGTLEADKVNFINSSVDYSLSGAGISGSTEVEVSGGGTVSITSSHSFTGGVSIVEGSVVKTATGAGLGTGVLSLNAGEIGGVGGNYNFSGGPTSVVLGSNGGTLRQPLGRAFYGLNNVVISGDGQLILAGPGDGSTGGNNRLQMTGANTYTGGTLLTDNVNAIFYAGADNRLGEAGTAVTFDNGRFMSDANLNIGTREIAVASGGGRISLNRKTLTIGGPITGSGALLIDGQNRNINDGSPSGNVNLSSQTNTHSGGITIAENALVNLYGEYQALGTGDITLDGGKIKNRDNAPTFANNFIIEADGGTLTSGWSKDITINGDLFGSGDLTIGHDSGVIYLNGDGSSYTGTVNVASGGNPSNDVTSIGGVLNLGGSLVFQTNTALIATTDNTIVLGGDLILNNATLSLSGTLEGAGAIVATVAGSITGEFAGYPEGAEVQPGYEISYLGGAVTINTTSPFESPTVDMSIADGVITLAWPDTIVAGDQFNVLTNVNLVHGTWGTNTSMVPFLNGSSYSVTNAIGSAPEVFYLLEAK